MQFIYILAATSGIVSLALLAFLLLSLRPSMTKRLVIGLVAVGSGTLMSSAFLHLLPEALEILPVHSVMTLTLGSFITFFLLEKVFHWHCHTPEQHRHSVGYLNLLTDALHNFLDGLVIATAFLVNPVLGLTTTLAVALHELPQEVGDYGVLLLAKFSTRQALITNTLVASTVILGGIVGYWFAESIGPVQTLLLPIAAGGFLYLGASDLLPELRTHTKRKSSAILSALFLLGVLLIPLVGLLEPAHTHVEPEHSEEFHLSDNHSHSQE